MKEYSLEDYFSDSKDYLTAECTTCEQSQTFEIVETIVAYKQGSYGHPGQYRCRCVMCRTEQVVVGKNGRQPKKRRTI